MYHLVATNFADEGEERILLIIDSDKITAAVIWEDLRNCGDKFPHIYGLLSKYAIINILPHIRNHKRKW